MKWSHQLSERKMLESLKQTSQPSSHLQRDRVMTGLLLFVELFLGLPDFCSGIYTVTAGECFLIGLHAFETNVLQL